MRADGTREPEAEIAGIRFSHPDRLIYSAPPITKLALAQYYATIADWVVPHVAGRPLTLVHCATGVGRPCVYMKHSKVWGPDALRRVRITEKTKVGEYLVADDIAGVIALVQMGVVEIHTWNTVTRHIERPNRIVWDLDPGPDVAWDTVIAAARELRDVLLALGLESWVKTTGGRGLHVVVPIESRHDWSECLLFARAFADVMVRSRPERYTTRYARQGRSQQILIDYLRNNRTNTSVAAFSSRARAGAPVSMPLTWDQLRPATPPSAFTVMTVPERLRRTRRDPWAGYWIARQRLTRAMREALRQL
jgi:bifunctional non-homologous end joining protein LigD